MKGSKDLLTPINGKSNNWTPSEILRISLRGIKHFEAKKVDKPYWFLKSNIPFLTQNSINGKSLNWTPTGYATHLPSEDKNNWTATGYASHLPSADKTFLSKKKSINFRRF